jgi:hypothetical protein
VFEWDDGGLEKVDLKHHEFERAPQDVEPECKSTIKMGKALEIDLDGDDDKKKKKKKKGDGEEDINSKVKKSVSFKEEPRIEMFQCGSGKTRKVVRERRQSYGTQSLDVSEVSLSQIIKSDGTTLADLGSNEEKTTDDKDAIKNTITSSKENYKLTQTQDDQIKNLQKTEDALSSMTKKTSMTRWSNLRKVCLGLSFRDRQCMF